MADSSAPGEKLNADTPAGFAFGFAAYGLWGVIPLYFKLLTHVAPVQVLAHRAVWSFGVLLVAICALRKVGEVLRVVADRRTLLTLVGSATLIAINWFAYIYAVTTDQVPQASLGYYITPLANVLIGVALLGERMRGLQIAALGLAAAGVGILTFLSGSVPWIAVALAISFSLYGLLRKIARAEAMVGLFVETSVMTPIALGFLLSWYREGTGVFTQVDSRTDFYLMIGGIVTTIPLVCFAAAARKLRMTTLGFLQFLSPTLQLAIAVFLFGNEYTSAHKAAFPLIWLAVALYLTDAVLTRRRAV